MFEVKFIQGWNLSFGFDEETDITPTGLEHTELDHDPERFMSEDFFLREPREARIKFFRTQFLLDHFVYPPADEIINVVLYKDEDGNIIEESQYDPETCTKDVVVNRYSKIIVKILEDDRLIFLGLVQLNEVPDDTEEISITCTDFLDLFQSYSEALIYNVPGENSYGYYFSKSIVQSLIDIIVDTTGLNLQYSLNDDIFMEWVSDYTVYSDPNLDPDLVTFTVPQYSNWVDYWQFTNVLRTASVPEESVVFYQVFGFWVTSAAGETYYCSIKWKKYSPITGWSDELETTYTLVEDLGVGGYDRFLQQIDDWRIEWLASIGSGQLFLLPPDYFYYVEDNRLVRFRQEWWSAAIPYRSGNQKYIDLLKVITLVNNLTIYQDGNGVFFSKRTDLPQSTGVDIEKDTIYKPFLQKDITRDELEYDALDILWVDPEGDENKLNKEHVKEMYNDIFGSTFQKEIEGYVHCPSEVLIPGCTIRFVMDSYVHIFFIISVKKEDVWYKIIAYRVSISELQVLTDPGFLLYEEDTAFKLAGYFGVLALEESS